MTARTKDDRAGTPKAEARDAGHYRPPGRLVDFDPWGALLAAMGDGPGRGVGAIDQPHALTRWQTCSRSRLAMPSDALAELTRLQEQEERAVEAMEEHQRQLATLQALLETRGGGVRCRRDRGRIADSGG